MIHDETRIRAWIEAGKTAAAAGEFATALAHFQRALEQPAAASIAGLAGEVGAAACTGGDQALAAERIEGAVALWRFAANVDPTAESPPARLAHFRALASVRADTAIEAKDLATAERWLRLGLEIAPQDPTLVCALASVRANAAIEAKDLAAAERWLRLGLEIAPQDPMLVFQWGRVLENRGDLRAAIAAFQQSHRISAFEGCLVNMAYMHQRLDEPMQAAACWLELAGMPGWGRGAVYATTLLNANGLYEETERALASRPGLRATDENSWVMCQYALAEARFRLSRFAHDPLVMIDLAPFADADRLFDPRCDDLPAVQGTFPRSDAPLTIFTTVDPDYFKAFGLGLALSAEECWPRYGLHFHLINPDRETELLLEQLAGKLARGTLSTTHERIETSDHDGFRVYCAAARYIRAAQLAAATAGPVLVTDGDLLFMAGGRALVAGLAGCDAAFLNPEPQGLVQNRYAAGLTLFNDTPLARRLASGIGRFVTQQFRRNAPWGIDQFALFCVSERLRAIAPELSLDMIPGAVLESDRAILIPNERSVRSKVAGTYGVRLHALLARYGFDPALGRSEPVWQRRFLVDTPLLAPSE